MKWQPVAKKEGGELFAFHDVPAARQEDPATKAARRLDWESFFAGNSAACLLYSPALPGRH